MGMTHSVCECSYRKKHLWARVPYPFNIITYNLVNTMLHLSSIICGKPSMYVQQYFCNKLHNKYNLQITKIQQ